MSFLRRQLTRLAICLGAPPRAHVLFAANEAAPEIAELASAANETVEKDGWVLLAPYGDWDNSQGMQRFQRADADNIVNEFGGLRAAGTRLLGLPWYIGHPDHDAFEKRYPDQRAVGRIKQLKATDEGLAASVKWNAEGRKLIEDEAFHGHSVNWAMKKTGGVWRPFRLASVGFTNRPNIPVPPVTAANESTNEPTMNKKQLAEWLKTLGIEVANEAPDEQFTAALTKVGERVTTAVNEATTANTALREAKAKLTTAEDKAKKLETDFANERAARVKPLLDSAVTDGRLTAAERPALEAEFANEATFDTALGKLTALKPKLHTAANAKSAALGQRNAGTRDRLEQIETAVNERMAKDKCDRTEAYIRLRREKHALFADAVQTDK